MNFTTNEQRLQSILHAYLQAGDRGESPDRQALLDAHPELRDELAAFFADASRMEAMAQALRTSPHVESGRASGGRSAPTPAELAERFPQLEILELLGQGGMGAVYKARQRGLDRLVALKILPPDTGKDPAFAERFLREARALARLSHPNIVGVHDVGQTADGLCFFLMEYIDGVNLRQALQAGEISPREALAIVPQICDALQFAHDEGIVHRDIKPENVLLDRKGRVKIADFGLAKLLGVGDSDVSLTGTHQVMGTLRYMAPEQMEGSKQIDHRADIYSLGVVFYELLTGELPMGRFAPPSKKVQIDVRLDEVVLRALEREPEQRWQQASEVKTEVEAIRSDAKVPSAESPVHRAPVAVREEPASFPVASPGSTSQPASTLLLLHPKGLGLFIGWLAVLGILAVVAALLPRSTYTSYRKHTLFQPKSGAYSRLALGGTFQSVERGGTVTNLRPARWDLEIEVTDNDLNTRRTQTIHLPIPLQIKYTFNFLTNGKQPTEPNPAVRAEIEALRSFVENSFSTPENLPSSWDEFHQRATSDLRDHYREIGFGMPYHGTETVKPFWPVFGWGAGIATILFAVALVLTRSRAAPAHPDDPTADRARQSLRFRVLALLPILLLHGAAFLWPAIAKGGTVYHGFQWVGSIGQTMPSSLNSNVFFWIGCVLLALGYWRSVVALGFVAVFLAAVDHRPFDPNMTYLAGLWMWVGSLLMLPAAGIVGCVRFGRASRWLTMAIVFAASLAVLIRHNLHYRSGPPDPAPYEAIGMFFLLNLALLVWAVLGSIRDWMADADGAEALLQRRIRGLAVAMLVVGSLGILACLCLGGANVVLILKSLRNLDPSGPVFWALLPGSLLALASRIVTVYAGTLLLRRQGRGWGIASCVLMFLPTDPIALLAIPVGIWGLVTLLREDVAARLDQTAPLATPWRTPPLWVWLTGWSLVCFLLFMVLWKPIHVTSTSLQMSKVWSVIDQHFWPWQVKQECIVTLTPSAGGCRKLVITQHAEASDNGARDLFLGVWSNGPGVKASRNDYVVQALLPSGAMSDSLVIDGRTGTGPRAPLPFDAEEALEWLRSAGVPADEKVLQAQARGLTAILLRAMRGSSFLHVGSQSNRPGPIGQLDQIAQEALRNELGPIKDQSGVFTDQAGTVKLEFKPVVPILYVGVPVMLVVWLVGCLVLARWRQHRAETVEIRPMAS